MTKISKKAAYPIKKPIDKDYFVGSDSELFGKTVNFSFEETAYLINKLNGSLIVNYLFKTDNNINLEVLTEGVFLSEDNETEVSSITKLYINKKNFSGDDLSELYTFLKVNKNSFFFKLQNSEDLKNACYFNISNVVDHTDYFIFNINVFLQNQALQSLIHFNVYFFSFDIKSAAGNGNEDKFTSVGTISLVDNEITISTGFEWEINSGEFANVVPFIETIPFSTTGNQRFVLFVANAFDTFEMISGPESISNPVAPPVPENTIQLTLLLVTDGVIGDPTLPDLSDYATIDYVDGRLEDYSNVDNTSDINKPVSTDQALADAVVLASANSYTDAGLATKLNTADYNDRWKGKYTSYALLIAAHPTANAGDYAQVDEGASFDVINYNYDLENGWIEGGSGSAATNTDMLPEGLSNLYFTTARVLATLLTGISFATGGAIVSTDSVLVAFGKLQKQITDLSTIYQVILTDVNFGAFINGLTSKTTPIDADSISIVDSADSNKQKKVSLTNFKAFLKTYFDTQYKVDTISLVMSDTGSILVTGDTDPMNAPYNFTLINYWIGVKTAPTVSGITVDVKKNGSSVTSTKAGIDATEKTSLTGTTPVLTTTSFAKGDEITPNIFAVGSGESGRALKLYLEIIKT